MAKVKYLKTKRGLIEYLITNPPVGFKDRVDEAMLGDSYSLVKKGLFSSLSGSVASIQENSVFLHQLRHLEMIMKWIEQYEEKTKKIIKITVCD